MRVAVGFDHRGVALREAVIAAVEAAGHTFVDCGVNSAAVPVDYPDVAAAVGDAISDGRAERGILVCGSGVGACVAANKLRGIRAAICHDAYSAHQGVEHDDMNVLCLGSEIVGRAVANELATVFLAASFDGGERYVSRLAKVEKLEERLYGR